MASIKRIYHKAGLTSNQVKLIAVFFMTLGNFAAYGGEIPAFSRFSTQLTILGKIAAPLFLYMLTESVHFTKSKGKFILRLYFSAVGVGLFTTITNLCTGRTVGIYRQDNILFTYLYVAVYIVLIEKIECGFVHKKRMDIAIGFLGILLTFLVHFFVVFVRPIVVSDLHSADWFDSFFTSPFYIEYTPVFILMGVVIYFLKNKWVKMFAFSLFAVLARSFFLEEVFNSTPVSTFFNSPQRYMILALPFMLMYNGQRGKECKVFFYMYYPVHRYIIAVLAFLARP